MPSNHEWQDRIKAVEREYVVMRQAADHFRQAALGDPSIFQEGVRPREVIDASKNLEGTYIIRLFAEFETGSRQYWSTNWDTDPKTVDLLNGLAARCKVPDALRDNAHLVRDYRNALVHEREDQPEAVQIAVARSYLSRFFSYLLSPVGGADILVCLSPGQTGMSAPPKGAGWVRHSCLPLLF